MTTAAKPKKTETWYVVAVEPGMDRRAAKEIRRNKKIKGLGSRIGRVYCPIQTVKRLLPKAGEIMDSGTGPFFDHQTARQNGNYAAWKLVGRESEAMFTHAPAGVRVSVFPTKGKEANKEANTFMWVVRKETSQADRVVTSSQLKFPGYIIVKCKYDEGVHHLISSSKGVIGFLPMMPLLPRKPTKAQLEARDAWKPVALPSEAAAELLIQQQAENAKRKVESKKPVLSFGVGSEVIVTSGAFENLVGDVVRIGGEDKSPTVTVNLPLFGILTEVTLPHFEVRPNK